MSAFELRGEEEPRGADLMAHAAVVTAVLPDRAVKAAGDRSPHQRVVSRVELDGFEQPALAVVGAKLRHL